MALEKMIPLMLEGIRDTMYMTTVSTLFAYLLGLPLAIFRIEEGYGEEQRCAGCHTGIPLGKGSLKGFFDTVEDFVEDGQVLRDSSLPGVSDFHIFADQIELPVGESCDHMSGANDCSEGFGDVLGLVPF